MEKKTLLNTKEVAEFLNINEKMVYALIADKGLPATKVTGKWLFPRQLVEQWLENQTINYPEAAHPLPPYHGLLIICGSNDILLDRTISLFNRLYPEHLAVFGNIGSRGGLKALSRDLCHVASSHLLQEDEDEYNFEFAIQELEGIAPVLVNFCRREQGFLVAKGNPKAISSVSDLGKPGIKIANIQGKQIEGYDQEFRSHLDVGMEVLSGRADAAPAIKPVAGLLGLDFISLRWERYDLLILKERFFEQGVQLFLGILHESQFREIVEKLDGYDMSLCGKIVFPQQSTLNKEE
ncbi:MAG: helix-turn-helix transcriptional regulator [Deltaproteobacteria bacterium]|nr:helix-turn-helix transcriptional regulator [Deltaproteobacteria bacterium]